MGVSLAFHEEQNIRIHVLSACIVLVISIYIGISALEFFAILLSITLVIVTELINSIIERFSDMVKPQVSHLVSAVKDMSAAAVLLCALNACIIGGIVFLPKFFLFIQGILF